MWDLNPSIKWDQLLFKFNIVNIIHNWTKFLKIWYLKTDTDTNTKDRK
jgi:hypothetical protein